MSVFILCFLSILALPIGSFLGVLIDRIPKHESIIFTRSHCSHCKKELKPYDLIPIISYVLLRGRCRYCNTAIGAEYVYVEILTVIMFIITGLFFNASFDHTLMIPVIMQLLYTLFIVSACIVILFVDQKQSIIPNAIVYPAIAVTFFYILFIKTPFFIDHVLAGIGAFAFFYFLYVCTQGRGMGFGDVKFALLLGLFLGFPHIVTALYLAFLTGGAAACILVLTKKKHFHQSVIPFGPFLVFGGFVSFYYGTNLEKIFLHVL